MNTNYSSAKEIYNELLEICPGRVQDNESIRRQHGDDLSWNTRALPDLVITVRKTEEISTILKLCNDSRVPVIAYGVGTSLEGHIHAPYGGVCIDLSEMNEILDVRTEDMTVTVQAGVTRMQLDSHLRDTGLFFPIDPGADATIGGMAATRASGTNAVRYGAMKENILNLTVVTADGRIIKTAKRARKSSAGYDLTHLMIGSEGTLGIITEITLKLHGQPEAVSGGICPFPDIHSACEATITTIQSGIPVARIELLDTLQVKASNQHSDLSLQETPHLFVEFHGSPSSVQEQSEFFQVIAQDFSGGPFVFSTKTEERAKLWKARHDALWAAKSFVPDTHMIITDICVPISSLAEMIDRTQELIKELDLTAPLVGHVGDGNFHLFVMVDMNNEQQVANAKALLEKLVELAHRFDGTCTGEHGIGKGKIPYLEKELGKDVVAIMKSIKRTLDPNWILNPGNIFEI